MAITHLEGFDDGIASEFATLSPAGNIGSSYGKNGNGMRLGDTASDGLYYPPTPAGSLFTMGFHMKIVGGASGYIIRFTTQLQGGIAFQWDSTAKRVGLTTSTSTINDWSANGSVDYGEWHYHEIQMLANTSNAGSYKLWLDGALYGSGTSIDYPYVNDSTAYFGTNLAIDDFYIDNLYVTDATGSDNTAELGEIEVATLFPNANGNYSQLTGSDGNSTDNYQLVDENPPVTTDYVGSGTEGNKDTYGFEDITGSPDIAGAVLRTYDAKNDTGAKYLRHVARVNSTDYNSSSFALSESWNGNQTVYDVNPNTSTAWTQTTINGAEFGQEVRDS